MNGEDATAIIGEVAACLDDAYRTIDHLTAENDRLRGFVGEVVRLTLDSSPATPEELERLSSIANEIGEGA